MKKLISLTVAVLFLFTSSFCYANSTPEVKLEESTVMDMKLCFTEEEYEALDYQLMQLETCQDLAPKIDITQDLQILLTEDGQTFSKDLELRIWLPAKEDETNIIYDYTVRIDPNPTVQYKPYEPSWWEKNDFRIGVVIGGTVVGVSILTLAYLLGK